MAEQLSVAGEIRQGVPVLGLDYNEELLLKRGADERLSDALIRRYRELRQQGATTSSAVVEVRARVAGTSVIKALFNLWREVVGKERGQVVCVKFPPDYLDSLTSVGLTALSGFTLGASVEDALQRVTKA